MLFESLDNFITYFIVVWSLNMHFYNPQFGNPLLECSYEYMQPKLRKHNWAVALYHFKFWFLGMFHGSWPVGTIFFWMIYPCFSRRQCALFLMNHSYHLHKSHNNLDTLFKSPKLTNYITSFCLCSPVSISSLSSLPTNDLSPPLKFISSPSKPWPAHLPQSLAIS